MVFEATSVYGLCLQANGPIPGFMKTHPTATPDIQIFIGTTPEQLKIRPAAEAKPVFATPDLNEHGLPFFVVDEFSGGDFYRLSYHDGAEFVVDYAGTRIWVNWTPTQSLDEVSSYLFGPVIGWVLRLRGALCLHASAVAVKGSAVAFVGESGAGKSTLAATFARRGYTVVTDDVVAIFVSSGSLLVEPSYPELWLWPDSASALNAADDSVFDSQHANDKLRLNLRKCGRSFQKKPLPLKAVYVLNCSDAANRSAVQALTQRQTMMSLIANTHAGRLLDQARRKQEFGFLADLIARVPVCELFRGTDLAQLDELCDEILSHLENQSGYATSVSAVGA